LVCDEDGVGRKLKQPFEQHFVVSAVCGERRFFTHVAATSGMDVISKICHDERVNKEESLSKMGFAKFSRTVERRKYISLEQPLPAGRKGRGVSANTMVCDAGHCTPAALERVLRRVEVVFL
jgi:hypothetical protein